VLLQASTFAINSLCTLAFTHLLVVCLKLHFDQVNVRQKTLWHLTLLQTGTIVERERKSKREGEREKIVWSFSGVLFVAGEA
jgi:hypothetical protein